MINNYSEWQIFYTKTETLNVTWSNILILPLYVWPSEEALYIYRVFYIFPWVVFLKHEGLKIPSFPGRNDSAGRMLQCFLRLGSGLEIQETANFNLWLAGSTTTPGTHNFAPYQTAHLKTLTLKLQ